MQNSDNQALSDKFHEYFDIELATTQAQLEKIFKIRYRVYCQEFGFLDSENYPNQLEEDSYDKYSYQCLVTHRGSGMPAACVRVVPAVTEEGERPLPFETLGSDLLDKDFFDNFSVPRSSLCEISRLAVDGAFRRRSGEAATRFGEIDSMDITQIEKRTFGLITVATFLASACIAELNDQPNGFAMMEPFLPRLMNRSGIRFERAGRDIDYHGLRGPYFVKLESILDNMNPDLRSFYDSISERLVN
ncbi:MAG: PEP-CTERM/exosortase system-associated acyltransferase [Halioglobus sp.]